MAVHIVWNTLRDSARRTDFANALREVLSERPSHEHWDVRLTESGALPGWIGVITTPDHKNVAWYFHGCSEEHSVDAVRLKFRMLLASAGW